MSEDPQNAASLPSDSLPSASPIAEQLDRLRQNVLKVVATRERLPQPLFWSLFHTQLDQVKAARKAERVRRAALYECDWLDDTALASAAAPERGRNEPPS